MPNPVSREVSAPAIHYFLQLQHAFEIKHSRVQCRVMIDEYVNHHDGGLTLDTMRAACELPPRKRRAAEPSTLVAITAADGGPSSVDLSQSHTNASECRGCIAGHERANHVRQAEGGEPRRWHRPEWRRTRIVTACC